MAIGLLRQKVGMTRILNEDGRAFAVSVIKIEPNFVVQRKTVNKDGYNALQFTTMKKVNKKGQAKINRVNGAIKGHYKKASQEIGKGLWESRLENSESSDIENLDVSFFGVGHYVDVIGKSKGKGFQGGVKRHNFSMQDATHGNSVSHRALGSTGQCQDPGRVFKGKKMAGQMGNKQFTQECLEVLKVDFEGNFIIVKGSIPGANNSFVKVRLSHKRNKLNNEVSTNLKTSKESEEVKKDENKKDLKDLDKEVKK